MQNVEKGCAIRRESVTLSTLLTASAKCCQYASPSFYSRDFLLLFFSILSLGNSLLGNLQIQLLNTAKIRIYAISLEGVCQLCVFSAQETFRHNYLIRPKSEYMPSVWRACVNFVCSQPRKFSARKPSDTIT